MPVIRYFISVGFLLVALLFAADRYLPTAVAQADADNVDKTIIRIHSDRALPDKIVLDTQTPLTATPAEAASASATPSPAADAAAHDSFAQMVEPTVPSKQEAKQPPRKRVAEARPRPKRPVRTARRLAEPRLALGRQDFFFGGTW